MLDRQADTRYDYTRPWASNEERLTTEALIAATADQEYDPYAVRPPLPRTVLFPPKFGYRQDEFRIDDVVRVDSLYPGARVDYSGSVSGYQGTSTPSLNVW